MDENKINPIPADDPEVEQELPAAEEAVAEETQVTEQEDAEAVQEAEEEVVSEESADDTAENEDSEAEADDYYSEEAEPEFVAEEAPAPKKKKSKGAIALLTILVALLLGVTVFFVSVIIKNTVATKIDHDEIAVTVGDDEITVGEYLYWFAYVDAYYYNYYSYYYSQIPEDQIKSETLTQLAYTSALYKKAVDAGYELSEEDKAQIDASMDSYVEAAEASSIDVDDYVAENFGKGYTLEMLRTYLEKQAVAYSYYEDAITEIENEFRNSDVEDKVEKAYAANKSIYDLANVTYCYFDATDEDAEKNANAVVAEIKGGKSFEDAVKTVKGDDETISDSLTGLYKDAISSNFSEDAAEWIFEVDADGKYVNGNGAATTLESGGVIYVLYVNEAPARNSFIPVSFELVQIDVSTDDSIKSEDELKLQAKSKANTLFAEFEETDKTAEAFIEFAEEANADESGLVTASSEEDVVSDGSHDDAIENWMTEEGRKAGDYALLEGEDGTYYIVFMTAVSENPVWYNSVFNSLLEAELTEWEKDFASGYEDSIVTNDDVINNAVTAFKNITSSAE